MSTSNEQNGFALTAATQNELPNRTTRRDFLQGSLAVAGTVLASSVAPVASAELIPKRPNLVS
jgi:hypothetical protein